MGIFHLIMETTGDLILGYTINIMIYRPLVPLVVLVAVAFFPRGQCSPAVLQRRGICATEDPDTSFLDVVERVKTDENLSRSEGSESRQGPIEVETWFHIITSKSEADQVSDDMINSQVGHSYISR